MGCTNRQSKVPLKKLVFMYEFIIAEIPKIWVFDHVLENDICLSTKKYLYNVDFGLHVDNKLFLCMTTIQFDHHIVLAPHPNVIGAPPTILQRRLFMISFVWGVFAQTTKIRPFFGNQHLWVNQLHIVHELLFDVFQNGMFMLACGTFSQTCNPIYGNLLIRAMFGIVVFVNFQVYSIFFMMFQFLFYVDHVMINFRCIL